MSARHDDDDLGRDHVPTLTSLLIVLIDETRATNANLVALREAIERGGAASKTKDALITPREFAEILAVDERTLRRMRSGGELPKNVGAAKRPRWRRSDVEAHLAKLKAKRS